MKNFPRKLQLKSFLSISFLILLFCSNSFSQLPTLKRRPPDTTDSKQANNNSTKNGSAKKNSIGMEFVYIPPGQFLMGTSETDITQTIRILNFDYYRGKFDAEKPQHRVIFKDGFWLGKYEVTQGQWKMIQGDNPSGFNSCGLDCPVENMTWQDTQCFISALNQIDKEFEYSLPSESQWEYAARAGTKTIFSGKNINDLAWYESNSGGRTHPVGQKTANAFGLYDMHGNVWEWVQDRVTENYVGVPVDGSANVSFGLIPRVTRGGSWNNNVFDLRSANRSWSMSGTANTTGFRIVAIPKTGSTSEKKTDNQNNAEQPLGMKSFPLPSKTRVESGITYSNFNLSYRLNLPDNWFPSVPSFYAPSATYSGITQVYTPDKSLTQESLEQLKKQCGRIKIDGNYIRERIIRGVIFGTSETNTSNLYDAANEHFIRVKKEFPHLKQDGNPRRFFINGQATLVADFTGRHPVTLSQELRQVYVTYLEPPNFSYKSIFIFEVFAPQDEFQTYKSVAQEILKSTRLSKAQ